MAISEADFFGGAKSLLSQLAQAVEPFYAPHTLTPPLLSTALAVQQSTDLFLQDYAQHHAALQERIKVLWGEVQALKGKAQIDLLGLVVTSDIPRGFVEEHRMSIKLQVIDRGGRPRPLPKSTDCDLTVEEYIQSKRHGKQSNQVFAQSWQGVLDTNGQAEFRGLWLPEYDTSARKSVTLTVTCRQGNIAPLVIEDLPVSKARVRKARAARHH